MKKWIPFAIMIIGAALLLTAAIVAKADVKTTQAIIAFTNGELTWDNELPNGVSGMDFNFGSNEPPIAEESYASQTPHHMIRLRDSRVEPGKWHVMVEMTQFTAGEESFMGKITLSNPTPSHEEMRYGDGENIVIMSGAGKVPVVMYEDGLRAVFFVQWPGSGATLSLSEEEAQKITGATYQAEMIWTLTMGM